jgi:hypothetical protein
MVAWMRVCEGNAKDRSGGIPAAVDTLIEAARTAMLPIPAAVAAVGFQLHVGAADAALLRPGRFDA